MDKEKAEAYKIIADIGCKAFIVFVICLGWIAMVIVLIRHPNYPLGIGVAGGPFAMMKLMGRHFFPPKKEET